MWIRARRVEFALRMNVQTFVAEPTTREVHAGFFRMHIDALIVRQPAVRPKTTTLHDFIRVGRRFAMTRRHMGLEKNRQLDILYFQF